MKLHLLIVGGKAHSHWSTEEEAIKQVETLFDKLEAPCAPLDYSIVEVDCEAPSGTYYL